MIKNVSGMTNQNKAVIAKIISRHGTKLDLEAQPEVLVEILRNFGPIFADDGGLPGGVGPIPPPTCLIETPGVTGEEVMKAILKLSRDIASIKASVAKLKQG